MSTERMSTGAMLARLVAFDTTFDPPQLDACDAFIHRLADRLAG